MHPPRHWDPHGLVLFTTRTIALLSISKSELLPVPAMATIAHAPKRSGDESDGLVVVFQADASLL